MSFRKNPSTGTTRRGLSALVAFLILGVMLPISPVSGDAGSGEDDAGSEAARFLSLYDSIWMKLYYQSAQAEWLASTDVTPEHDAARVEANKAYSGFIGDGEIIRSVRRLQADEGTLTPLQSLQLKKIMLSAAEAPGTIPDIVGKRVEAESRQSSLLDSFEFCMQKGSDGECSQPISANEIDNTLRSSRDLAERLKVWQVSKQTGPVLRDGLEDLQSLRNELAREMGHSSFFGLQVADFGMTVPEMMTMLRGFLDDISPLYKELHCWTKYELAERYGTEVPDLIPAHWLDNRWSQSWPGIVESVDLDPLFAGRSPEWIVKQSEKFYVSMGFPGLPDSFWEKSDLYPVEEGSTRKKNTHASAWHLNREDDIRSLMSVESNARWFTTSHHELGHIYYYIAYSRPEIPLLLRRGANRAFHEGIGELISVAATQVPYLRQVGVLPEDQKLDPIAVLLAEALTETIPFIPWSAGVMSHFEHDLYEKNLPKEKWNETWWGYVEKFQGVSPPAGRGSELCDACTKSHINDDPAQYYDYAIAAVLKYQLHEHIARKILKQEPTSCNYYGSKETGEFLNGILRKASTEDWRKVIREATGSDLSTRPMLEYFRPLLDYLKKENQGRTCSWG